MTRCARGHFIRTIWVGFGRWLHLCGECDKRARMTTELARIVYGARK